jgi:hypothetical protein
MRNRRFRYEPYLALFEEAQPAPVQTDEGVQTTVEGGGGKSRGGKDVSLKAYLNKRLADFLEEKPVVVWYDGEKAFGEVALGSEVERSKTAANPDSKMSGELLAEHKMRIPG